MGYPVFSSSSALALSLQISSWPMGQKFLITFVIFTLATRARANDYRQLRNDFDIEGRPCFSDGLRDLAQRGLGQLARIIPARFHPERFEQYALNPDELEKVREICMRIRDEGPIHDFLDL